MKHVTMIKLELNYRTEWLGLELKLVSCHLHVWKR